MYTDKLNMDKTLICDRTCSPGCIIQWVCFDNALMVDKSMNKGILVISFHPTDFPVYGRTIIGSFMGDNPFYTPVSIPVRKNRQKTDVIEFDIRYLHVLNIFIDIRICLIR